LFEIGETTKVIALEGVITTGLVILKLPKMLTLREVVVEFLNW
jgi:hypothetical protein